MTKQVEFKDIQAVEKFLLDALSQYVDLATVTAVPRSERASLYQEGVSAYRIDDYETALSCFAQLVVMEPLAPDFWMGLASALHKSQQLEKALSCYAIVALLDDNDPAAHFHAAQIFFHWKDEVEFSKAVELAHARATLSALHMPWLEKIEQLKDLFYQKGRRAYGKLS
jgi:tetratricopeptide (TPR) repeat protein